MFRKNSLPFLVKVSFHGITKNCFFKWIISGSGTGVPSREDLVTLSKAFVPVLIERAPECERLQRAPDDTIEDFRKAGFF